MATFLTADWHLGDERLDMLGRPFASAEELARHLVREHNALVAPDDELYMIGDVVATADPHDVDAAFRWLELVARFHGRKTLIRGNQDFRFSDADVAPYFERVVPEGEGIELPAIVRDVYGAVVRTPPLYATHYPTLGRSDCFNLVGHIHGSWKTQLNALNVGVDVHHFRPVSLDQVAFFFKAICDYYDQDVWVAYDPVNSDWRERGKPGTYFESRDEIRAGWPRRDLL